MENFTPISALIGGSLIGVSASLLLLFNGRVAGISGILNGVIFPRRGNLSWSIMFLVGLIAGAAIYRIGFPTSEITVSSSLPIIILGGVLVGFGTRISGGCTSGHGVCGIAMVRTRSLIATPVFILTAVATLFIMRHVIGS